MQGTWYVACVFTMWWGRIESSNKDRLYTWWKIFRNSNLETKRRLFSYFEVLEICREINKENGSKNIKRNVSVIQDIDGNNIVIINDIRFKGKRSVDWKDVRAYLKEYVGEFYTIAAQGIPELIEIAIGKYFNEEKHWRNAIEYILEQISLMNMNIWRRLRM